MSLKLYYAYRYNGSIEKLHKDLVPIRNKYRDGVKVMYAECMSMFLTNGEKCNFSYKAFKDIYNKPYTEFIDQEWAIFFEGWIKQGLRDPLNTSASIMVYPFEKGIYLLPFINHFYDVLENHESLSGKTNHFGYWDNTDPDPECSEDEWDERSRIWHNILGSDPAKDYGFVFEIYDVDDVWRTISEIRFDKLLNDTKEEEDVSENT